MQRGYWKEAPSCAVDSIAFGLETNGQNANIEKDYELLDACLAHISESSLQHDLTGELDSAKSLSLYEDDLEFSEAVVMVSSVRRFLSTHLVLSTVSLKLDLKREDLEWIEEFVCSSTRIEETEDSMKKNDPIHVCSVSVLETLKGRLRGVSG